MDTNTCNICGVFVSKRSKVCASLKCRSKWKMERNKNLTPKLKICASCGQEFPTVDRRNNYCSTKCKYQATAKTMMDKYGYSNPMEKPKSPQELLNQALRRQKSIEQTKLTRRKYYENNKEKYYKAYEKRRLEKPDDILKINKKYGTSEKGKLASLRAREKRRAHEDLELSVESQRIIRAIQDQCLNCGTIENLTWDHHIPVALGGKLDLSNTIVLCRSCNSSKQHKTPNEFYAIEKLLKAHEYFKYIEFLKENKPKMILLAGAPGAGKSWVCRQLNDKFPHVDSDKLSDQDRISKIIESIKLNKIPLMDLSFKVSTFLEGYSEFFTIELVTIDEPIEVISKRILSRGGKITSTLYKRFNRIKSLTERASFHGTSDQVLEYLTKY